MAIVSLLKSVAIWRPRRNDVVAEHGGEFPATSAALAQLPGIGRSTAAAIAAFCFGERVAILDGNVKRVLARVLAFDGDLAEARAERELWAAATALLPAARHRGVHAGPDGPRRDRLPRRARRAACSARRASCCAAARAGTQERYPVKSRRLVRGRREQRLARAALARRGLAGRSARRRGVWAGLWSLPELDSIDALDAATAGWPGQRRGAADRSSTC